MICGLDSAPRPGPPNPDIPCCMASAVDPDDCTCWKPVHEPEQEFIRHGGPVTTRTTPCRDCAYRPGSPELERGDDPPGAAQPFWCHQGMRRITGWRHPNVDIPVAAEGGAYDPAIIDGVPYKADGEKADLCAGWLAQHSALVDVEILDERVRP